MLIISLPNLLNNSKTTTPVEIDGQSYMMSFEWLDDYCLFSMYKVSDGENVYVIKPKALTINMDLIRRINDPDLITGSFYFMNKYNIDIEPVQANFHTDYNLIWVSENE